LRICFSILLVGALALPCGAVPVRKSYVDWESGVSFSYPAGWLLNGDDDAATAKLRIVSAGQPLAVVQLEGNFADEGPYKDTDFEAGAFAFVVTPGASTDACYGLLGPMADGQAPVAAMVGGVAARRVDLSSGIAGTEDRHRIVAAYRRGKCYLLETVVVSKNADLVAKPLTAGRWGVIRGAFEGVLGSVRIGGLGGGTKADPSASPRDNKQK
jgi:hypothetical protein